MAGLLRERQSRSHAGAQPHTFRLQAGAHTDQDGSDCGAGLNHGRPISACHWRRCIVHCLFDPYRTQSAVLTRPRRATAVDAPPPVPPRGRATDSPSFPLAPASETVPPNHRPSAITPDPPAPSSTGAAESTSQAPSPSLETKDAPIPRERPPVPAWHAWSLPSSDLKIAPPVSPKCMTFFDVETTGLNSNDRIVTLAAIKLMNPDTCATRLAGC